MKKKLLLILLFAFCIAGTTKAQTNYTVDKVANGTLVNGDLKLGKFAQLKTRFQATLFNNALVFDEGYDGSGNTYFKFTRKIPMNDNNSSKWNALDRYKTACQITIVDGIETSFIMIKYIDSNKVTVYRTL